MPMPEDLRRVSLDDSTMDFGGGESLTVDELGSAILKNAIGTTPGSVADGKVVADLASDVAGKASLGHTPAPDADYQALSTDVQIGFLALSAPRTVYLPDVDTYPLGQVLFIADESGACSPDRPITISTGPGTNDTIAGQTGVLMTDPYQGIGFRRGAANVWIIAR